MTAAKAPAAQSSASAFAQWWKRNELPRKLLHGSIAFISIALYWNGVQLSLVTPVLVTMLIPIATLEVMRFASPDLNRRYIAAVGPLMREDEKNKRQVNGVIWYLVGLIYVFTLFPKDISFMAILLLSWADLAASTVGRTFGYLTPKLVGPKSLAGTLAAFASGFISVFLVYNVLLPAKPQYNRPSDIMYVRELSRMPMAVYALLTGLTVSLAELFPVVDDNLSIPIVCGTVLWALVKATTLPYTHNILA